MYRQHRNPHALLVRVFNNIFELAYVEPVIIAEIRRRKYIEFHNITQTEKSDRKNNSLLPVLESQTQTNDYWNSTAAQIAFYWYI